MAHSRRFPATEPFLDMYLKFRAQHSLSLSFFRIAMLNPNLFVVECVLTALNLLYLCRAEKMAASFLASSAAAESTGKVFDVNVGNLKAELVFEPDTVIASVGDIINFHFYPINHSVAQSSFDKPCQPLQGGVGQIPIFSGFLPVKDGESVS
jgi:plastocyanin